MTIEMGPVPIDEVTDEDEVPCAECGDTISDGHEIGDDLYCEDCIAYVLDEIRDEADQYAIDECRITSELPKYDPELGRWATPKKYLTGDRESYLCFCREHHTNYADLVARHLGPYDLLDLEAKEFCEAYSERLDAMLKEKLGWLGVPDDPCTK